MDCMMYWLCVDVNKCARTRHGMNEYFSPCTRCLITLIRVIGRRHSGKFLIDVNSRRYVCMHAIAPSMGSK